MSNTTQNAYPLPRCVSPLRQLAGNQGAALLLTQKIRQHRQKSTTTIFRIKRQHNWVYKMRAYSLPRCVSLLRYMPIKVLHYCWRKKWTTLKKYTPMYLQNKKTTSSKQVRSRTVVLGQMWIYLKMLKIYVLNMIDFIKFTYNRMSWNLFYFILLFTARWKNKKILMRLENKIHRYTKSKKQVVFHRIKIWPARICFR